MDVVAICCKLEALFQEAWNSWVLQPLYLQWCRDMRKGEVCRKEITAACGKPKLVQRKSVGEKDWQREAATYWPQTPCTPQPPAPHRKVGRGVRSEGEPGKGGRKGGFLMFASFVLVVKLSSKPWNDLLHFDSQMVLSCNSPKFKQSPRMGWLKFFYFWGL